jgi:hypothetical protein
MIKINLKSSVVFCAFFSFMLMALPENAFAGYRRCQGYPDNTSACINESGFRIDCKNYEGGARSICTGKNNYRKECFIDGDTGVCNDSNGVKTICDHSKSDSVCENSKGFRSICRSYDGRVTICTDVSRWGKPIKS